MYLKLNILKHAFLLIVKFYCGEHIKEDEKEGTKCCGRVINTPAFYLGGPRFLSIRFLYLVAVMVGVLGRGFRMLWEMHML
jgi:hypothetical protein